jgi:DNA-binding CsgD family transcriptional regulator
MQPLSKTKAALALLKRYPGMSKAEAARRVGIKPDSVYGALKRIKRTKAIRCAHCGQTLPYLRGILNKKD